MYFTGAASGPTAWQAYAPFGEQICNCTTNTSTLECPWHSVAKNHGFPTFMSYASQPAGPWSTPVLIPINGLGDTNLAATILPDGSVRAMSRGCLYTASNWRLNSTYEHFCSNVTGVVGEDPFVYMANHTFSNGTQLQVFHMVRHCNTSNANGQPFGTHGQPFGTHQWSVDGGFTWTAFLQEHAYPISANFTDASGLAYSMRERPHLIFDFKNGVRGEMLALTNGAAPICTGSPACRGRWNRVPPNRLGVPCTCHNGSDCPEYLLRLTII